MYIMCGRLFRRKSICTRWGGVKSGYTKPALFVFRITPVFEYFARLQVLDTAIPRSGMVTYSAYPRKVAHQIYGTTRKSKRPSTGGSVSYWWLSVDYVEISLVGF